MLHKEKGAFKKATALLGETLDLNRTLYGQEHERVAENLSDLGIHRVTNLVLARLAHWNAIAGTVEQAEDQACRVFHQLAELGLDAGTLAAHQSIWGDTLLASGDFERAEPLLLNGVAGMQTHIFVPSQIEAARERVVRLYTLWDKPEMAARYREKSL